MSRKPPIFYGWIILAISFAAMAIAYGARNSFSVFYVVILDEFGWSRATTAGIFSVNVVVYGLTAPLAGGLVDRFGPKKVLLSGGTILALATVLCSRVDTLWHFYLLFGVAGAIGTGLIGYPANAAVLPHWFVRRRGMAFGIFTSGFGASFLMVSLVQYFIIRFGWRIAFILLGVLIAVVLLPLIALFSRHRPQDMGLSPDGIHPLERTRSSLDCVKGPVVDKEWANTNWTLRRAMRTYQFWLMFFTSFCIFGLVENLVLVHQVALIRDVGFSRTFTTSIVALLGIMIAMGNLAGFVSDQIGRERTFNLGCLASIVGLSMLLLLEKSPHSWMPFLYAVFFGLGMGISGPTLGATSADMFQGKSFGIINGFITMGYGLGGIVGPWLGGFIFDVTKSYSIALIIAILVTCLAFVLLWIAAPRKIRRLR